MADKVNTCWGYLSRVDGNCNSGRVELLKEKYTFGRADGIAYEI